MTEILVQQYMRPCAVALGIGPTRIPAMVKRGAYRRIVPAARKPKEKTHFLREWRERPTEEFPDGMPQEILAERAGLSISSVSAYERYVNDPSVDALNKLSGALGVPRGVLLDVDPTGETDLWNAILKANPEQRIALAHYAEGMITPKSKKR